MIDTVRCKRPNDDDDFSENDKKRHAFSIITEINSMNYIFLEFILKNKGVHYVKKYNEEKGSVKTLDIDEKWDLSKINFYDKYIFNNNFYSFSNLENLSIKDITIDCIPNFEMFVNLKKLELTNIDIIYIDYAQYVFPKRLEYLSICECRLDYIPASIYTLEYLSELYLLDNSIETISDKIGNMQSMRYLNLGNNNITNIPITFSNLINLECLGFNNNPLKNVDYKITNLIKLKKLLLNNCSLTHIDSSFENLENLEGLDLANNPKLHCVPKFSKCAKLSDFCLDNVGLNTLPEHLFELKSLERLKISNNPVVLLPDGIGNLINLKFLEIYKTNIDVLPDTMGNMINMEELYLNFNKIKSIPDSFSNMKKLVYLDAHDNNICYLGPIFENIPNLKHINISNNKITMLPTNIIYAKNLMSFKYYNNPIITIQPQVKRFIDLIKNGGNFVRDTQSIHNSNVQKNLIKSIENITSQPLIINSFEITQEIINDNVLTKDCKIMIEKEYQNTEYHSVLKMNFREIFEYVWTYTNTIFNEETQKEIKNIINTELLESKELCFIGKITRLVASLNGFSNLVVITISDSEYISNTIANIKNILNRSGDYTIEKHRELVKQDLMSYGIAINIITNWVDYIE
jgi:Leucine-rich repeat (LRR) protein